MPELYMQCMFCLRHHTFEQLLAANVDAQADDTLACPNCLNSTFEARLMEQGVNNKVVKQHVTRVYC